jgi:hypothetical protein
MHAFIPIVLILLALGAQAADSVGRSLSVQGRVTARAPQAADRILAVKEPVFMQDVVRTAADSKTQILFADDTVFSQGPNTEVVIDEFVYDPANTKNNAFKAKVERGVFRTVTGKITDLNPQQFEIKTGRATIGIRGCAVSGRLSDRRDEISIDYVRTGRVVVVTPFGGQAVEFREPGLLVIEEGGKVSKRRFSQARLADVVEATTPNHPGRQGARSKPGSGFRREAALIQEEVVELDPPAKRAPPKPGRKPVDPGPAPWPVIEGSHGGFAMNQWGETLNLNPFDSSAQDPLHAAENFRLYLNSEQPDPAIPGGRLYEWPYSVSIPPAYQMPVFGSEDAAGLVTSERLDAETFQAQLTGPDYEVTMRVQRGGPESDWFKAWWGMDEATPARVRNPDQIWEPCAGFAVAGNTYSAGETAGLKNGAAVYDLQQSGAGWAAGLGHYSWFEGDTPSSGSFVLSGAPESTHVRIGGGEDMWSTRLRMQHTAASGVPAGCDVQVAGSLLDAGGRFQAAVTPQVNAMMIDGKNFQPAPPQGYGTARLVGSKVPNTLPTGLIGSMSLTGQRYESAGGGSYQMNLQFGTDLKKVDGAIGP